MAQTLYWVGGTGTQVWASAPNWSTTDGGAGSTGSGVGYPQTGDTVNVIRGTSNITGSDQSAQAYGRLLVSFRGTIGTSGNPHKFGIGRNITGTVTANSLANPTVVSSTAHGLSTGQLVTFSGTNSTPNLNSGTYAVTRIDANSFSVPVNVTSAGTAGTWTCQLGESIFSGDHGDMYLSPYLSSSIVDILSFLGNGGGAVTLSANASAAQGTYIAGPNCRVNIQASFDGIFTFVGLGNNTIDAGATNAPFVSVQSGRTTCARGTGAITILSGTLTMTGTGAAAGVTVVYPSGVLNYQSTGAIANLTTNTGAEANSYGAPGPITVTASTKWVRSKMFEQSDVPITYTATTVPRGYAS